MPDTSSLFYQIQYSFRRLKAMDLNECGIAKILPGTECGQQDHIKYALLYCESPEFLP